LFGRGEKGKREIKTRKPNTYIGFRVLISWFPCFNFSLSFFSSTKDTQRRDLRSALVEEKCGTVCDENVFLFSDEKFPITAAAHAERW
jgi:hypothetical protein